VASSVPETPVSAPDARAYFFLSCQEKVAKKKSRPPRRPAAPGPLRCSAPTGAAELGPAALRQSSPFFPLWPVLLDDAKGIWKTTWIFCRWRWHPIGFLSPSCSAEQRSAAGGFGEHCLRANGPSCAAARPRE
jgi:hypothetical protein